MDDIRTLILPLPTTISGFLHGDDDGGYTVVLNAKMSLERQREAYRHELEHIRRSDLKSAKKISRIEAERHK